MHYSAPELQTRSNQNLCKLSKFQYLILCPWGLRPYLSCSHRLESNKCKPNGALTAVSMSSPSLPKTDSGLTDICMIFRQRSSKVLFTEWAITLKIPHRRQSKTILHSFDRVHNMYRKTQNSVFASKNYFFRAFYMKSVLANSVLNYLRFLSLCNLGIQFLELCSLFIKIGPQQISENIYIQKME